ncbi:Shikimate kinase 2 [Klebsiella pasteurii]|uniref:Shikimate kinase 2 n=1 Tax=Klebsiella pasteurii TaxID=2587529 RepID=A0A9Q9UM86_9ENTR|nr:Shikimate kinase 2 [Klebsiella pasteurii]VUT16778.1 Shikimate kinase 2 [Klebsiella pasteurii]
MNTLFLIGPGGVGKSTVGALLAQAMSYRLIDLDSEFCEQVLNIRQYIQRDGYERYVRENAALCSRLLAENPHEKTSGGALLGISCEASDIKKIKDLEDENRRLKQMFADLSLENRALKDVIEKKL